MKVLSLVVLATFLVMQIHQISGETACGTPTVKGPESYGRIKEGPDSVSYAMFPWVARYFCANEEISTANPAILSEKYAVLTYERSRRCDNPSLYYMNEKAVLQKVPIFKEHSMTKLTHIHIKILELAENIRFSKFASPICLPTNAVLAQKPDDKYHSSYYFVPKSDKIPHFGRRIFVSKQESMAQCKGKMYFQLPSRIRRIMNWMLCTNARVSKGSTIVMNFGVTSKLVDGRHYLVGSSVRTVTPYILHIRFDQKDIAFIARTTGLNATDSTSGASTEGKTSTDPPSSGGSIYNIVDKHANK